MRLGVVVRPVGWTAMGTNREDLALARRMAGTPAFGEPDRGVEFWRELDRWLFTPPLEVTTSPQTSIQELTRQAVRAVRDSGAAVDWDEVEGVLLDDPAGVPLRPDGGAGEAGEGSRVTARSAS